MAQSLLSVAEGHGASFEGVVLWVSSAGAWEGYCGEVDVARGVEGNAACVPVGEPEDAEVGLDQAEHQADHQKVVGGFLGDPLGESLKVHLEAHLSGYLKEIQRVLFSFCVFNS